LIALSARLPVPLLLAVRVLARRPRRLVLGVASVAVTVTGIVAVLAGHARLAADRVEGSSGLDGTRTDRLNQVMLVVSLILVGLAAVNAVFITWSTVVDARRSSAVARTLGATPQQVSVGLCAAQLLPALVGAVLGIPGGLGLFAAVSDAIVPRVRWLVAVVPGTVLAVAVLTTIPARLGARGPVAEILQAEHA
jgi:putative ABC transport system permease protein